VPGIFAVVFRLEGIVHLIAFNNNQNRYMAQTSRRVAKLASRMLKRDLPRKQEKSVAGSDLRQARRHKHKK